MATAPQPRLIIVIGDSKCGGLGADVNDSTLVNSLPAELTDANIYSRWLDHDLRFSTDPESLPNLDEVGGPGTLISDIWVPITSIQNIQEQGATLAYSITYNDQLLAPSDHSRYIIVFSGAASSVSSVNATHAGTTWDPNTEDSLWTLFRDFYLRPALSSLIKPIEFGGLYFTLGNYDAQDSQRALDYTDAMTTLFEHIEKELGMFNIPSVGDRMSTTVTPQYPYGDIVLDAQQTIESEVTKGPLSNMGFVYSHNLLLQTDGIHWTHDSVIHAGINMSNSMIQARNIPGTEPVIK